MYVTDLRWYICEAGWRNWIFVELETDSGLVGVGEATVEGRELTMSGHLEDLKRVVVGSEALSIELMIRRLTRDPFWSGGFVASTGLAAVEIAMWDILGKHVGQPVWQLLGGRVRDRMRVYANGWYFSAKTIDDWVERAGTVVELGYTALKFDPFGRADLSMEPGEAEYAVEIVDALRSALGPRVDLLIEGHGRLSVGDAIRVGHHLARLNCAFFEEPVPPGNPDALRLVGQSTNLPIAAGERSYSRLDARRLLETGAVQVLQPDVLHVGGIAETRKLAALAESWFVQIAPHNPNGPVATAATLAVDTVTPNFYIQEMLAPWDVAWRHEVVRGCPDVVDGYIRAPDGPGLGLELDLEVIKQHPFRPIDPALWSENSIMEAVDLRPNEKLEATT